ncbi:MAG: M15 family metallopeptidase [Armatimonadota bacterium]
MGRRFALLTGSPLDRPIPPREEPPDWRRIPIVGNEQPLVRLPPTVPRLQGAPVYHSDGVPGAPDHIRVRTDVAMALQRAVELLPEPLGLRVHDGHRPVAVQQWLWNREWERVRHAEPALSQHETESRVRHFVAFPDPSPDAPPPHRTGGAVDVVLFDFATGEALDFGTPVDAPVPESATRSFENAAPNSLVRAARRILFHAMEGAGFANYAGEWWHFDLGNQRWANLLGHATARHGVPENE